MTNSLSRIFDGLIEALHTRVIPKIQDDSARAQAYGALDMLRNLKPRVEWAVGPLHEDVVAGIALARRIAALDVWLDRRQQLRFQQQLGETQAFDRVPLHHLDHRGREVRAYVTKPAVQLGGTGTQASAALPAGGAEEIDRAIRDQQRVRLKREVKLTAPPLFGEISRGQ